MSINRQQLLADDALRPIGKGKPPSSYIGKMFMYNYDPKHKKTLPYWDEWPLIFFTDVWKSEKTGVSGWAGINLHYLPPTVRIKLFLKLLETTTNKTLKDDTKLQINYGILKSVSKLSMFKPCYKRYLPNHLQSQIVEVPAPEWEIAVVLPFQKFHGASSQYVWTKSILGKGF